MKRTLFAICIATVALAVAATAAEEQNQKAAAGTAKKGKATATAATHTGGGSKVQASRPVAVHQNTSVRSVNHRATVSNGSKATSTAVTRSKTHATSKVKTGSNTPANRVASHEQGVRPNQTKTKNGAVTKNTTASERVNRTQNAQRGRASVNNANRNVTVNRTRNVNRNVTVVNHWSGNRFAGQHYAAFRNYHRAWHDRGWWHNHYNHITFVSGGWYFWNAGYWYPAWGYDPGYSYPYDGPIYGAASLTPNQIVVSVQQQLQAGGYYNGPVDGVLGSQTRYAIAAFQADHGLAVTSAVDEPTLSSLGLS